MGILLALIAIVIMIAVILAFPYWWFVILWGIAWSIWLAFYFEKVKREHSGE